MRILVDILINEDIFMRIFIEYNIEFLEFRVLYENIGIFGFCDFVLMSVVGSCVV